MKQWTRQVLKSQLKDEAAMLRTLREAYHDAFLDVSARIEKLLEREGIGKGNILQLRYQRRIKRAIFDTLSKLDTGAYKSIEAYMKGCYTSGALGAMYSLQRQGVPLLLPIDPAKVTASLTDRALLEVTLSKRLYKHVETMAATIQQELTRGVVQGAQWKDIARNIEARSNVGLRHAYTIARTEGHRVTEEARFQTLEEAQEYGVKVYKRWNAALDDRTRIHHIMLDGQTVPMDEPFRVAGLTAMYPGAFGIPEEDINCRCTFEEVAQWEIDEDLARTKYDGRAGKIINVGKASTFEAFKREYWKKFV